MAEHGESKAGGDPENRPTRIAHVGIAVRSLDEVLPFYTGALGLRVDEVLELPERGLRVAMVPCGESILELMEPLGQDSQIGSFLDKRGPGIHHICLEVDDIDRKLEDLDAAGVALVSKQAEIGAEGCPVAFIHPRSTGGVLLELLEER
ncbi:MAG: methylmalonyl-CoA epimerase [Deltaproteobacteria bacterium]|nr:methylmalonyl-CoA epimerase [Deltaproteobacteria bacterium]MCB9788164.1 methylmalonyl-CoA epimerase [Deltaproteobacteria bacterium]